MQTKQNNKIIYVNFDASYLKYLYAGHPLIWEYIIGDIANKLEKNKDKDLKTAFTTRLPGLYTPEIINNCQKKAENWGKYSNFTVSCSFVDFISHNTNEKKIMRLFAVKIALLSLCKKEKWALCTRQAVLSRIQGYQAIKDIPTLFKDTTADWSRLFKIVDRKNNEVLRVECKDIPKNKKINYNSKLWRIIKQQLKDEGINFYYPNGLHGFVFGLMSEEALKNKFEQYNIDKKSTLKQKEAIMKKINLPELPLPAQEEHPSDPPEQEPTKQKMQKRPKQQRPIYRDADQDFSNPETFT